MKRSLILVLLLFALVIAAGAQVAPQAASNGAVTDLGGLAGLGSIAYAVSAKGDVVAGTSFSNIPNESLREYRWTQAGGMEDLDPNGNDGQGGNAYGISADGNVIVGELGHYPECNPTCAFWWTEATGTESLYPPSGWYSPVAYGASKDGGVIVGSADQANEGPGHAWRWTSATGFVDINNWTSYPNGAQAYAVSENGSVIVGLGNDSAGVQHPVRWTQVGVTQDLGFLPGGSWALATGVSSNGSVVVGYGNTSLNCYYYNICVASFRWTKATGMVPLPQLVLSNGLVDTTVATGVSADGKAVVGWNGGHYNEPEAWRWTQATGLQTISDWLADVGVNAAAFNFHSAYAVTANGNGVVGQLTNGDAYLALATSNKTGMPTFSPKPGKYHGSVTVTLSHTSPDASIYYTTDGTTPTKNSTPYTAPIQVTVTTTIKAIAIVPSYPQSAVAAGKYTIK